VHSDLYHFVLLHFSFLGRRVKAFSPSALSQYMGAVDSEAVNQYARDHVLPQP
jgi:hypothetical protein